MTPSKSKKLIIFGLGDIARLALFYFEKHTEYKIVAFSVDEAFLPVEKLFKGLPVASFANVQDSFPASDNDMFIALSYQNMNKLRQKKFFEAKAKNYKLATYISPHCTYLSEFPPGENCFILEDNTVQPFVKIGHNVTLWSGNHIGHDSSIEDHTFVSSHVVVSGHCQIGKNCFLGVNSTLRNSIRIEDECLIGAGVAIMKSTAKGQVFLPPKPFLYEKSSSEVEL